MLTLRVSGMSCGHCAQTVTRAVEALPSVDRALVDLKAGEVSVDGTADESAIRQTIEEAGYKVQGQA